MKQKSALRVFVILVIMAASMLLVTGMIIIGSLAADPNGGINFPGINGGVPNTKGTLHIVSGSENETLEPIITDYAASQGYAVEIEYLGSVDIMLKLQEDDVNEIDAVWPASSIWLSVADSERIKHEQSVLRSPVVLGVRRSAAAALGWENGRNLKVEDLFAAINSNKLRFAMTNATQSNSGASGYLGFLYAFAGNPDVLKLADLEKPKVQNQTRQLLNGLSKTAGSSGWLKDVFLESYTSLDAMINYEAVMIEANQELVSKGQEPLSVFYLENGTVVADSPLAYVDKGDAAKEELFLDLQAFLSSDEAKQLLLDNGRRTGVGLNLQSGEYSPQVFNADWGIKPEINFAAVRVPNAEVIAEMLNLYQVSLRKPSYTVYVVDVSGSMDGDGITQLKSALNTLVDQDVAKRYLLQASPKDVHVLIPFNAAALPKSRFEGNNPQDMRDFLGVINGLQAGGGTDIYTAVLEAYKVIEEQDNINQYFASVILMTDGKSQNESGINSIPDSGDIPVFPIMFGAADQSQLKVLADRTQGRVFDGRENLVDAFRNAKGYN